MARQTAKWLAGVWYLGIAVGNASCGGSNEEAQSPQQPVAPAPYPPGQYPAGQAPAGQYPQGQYPQGQYPTQQYPAAQQPAPGQPGSTPQAQYPAAQPGAPAATAPGAVPGLPQAPPTAAAGSPAQAVDPSLAVPAQTILNQLAQSEAPGAKPVGAVLAGNFQAGQALQAQIQMQPGKCYTVLGAGLPPIAEVNLQLSAVSPLPGIGATILAQDQSTGLQAILGQKPNCYKWAWPIAGPVNVTLTVAAGSGIAAAQVYEK